MTFKEYIDRIQANSTGIFAIDEHCNGRFICSHMIFGFSEEDEDSTPSHKDDYVLWGENTSSDRSPVYIDSTQVVTIINKNVHVTDRDNNVLELTFFEGRIIPHPAE